jgi:hypothetical protein
MLKLHTGHAEALYGYLLCKALSRHHHHHHHLYTSHLDTNDDLLNLLV